VTCKKREDLALAGRKAGMTQGGYTIDEARALREHYWPEKREHFCVSMNIGWLLLRLVGFW
jgi:hypothetical protein